jgi:hypothetical protein
MRLPSWKRFGRWRLVAAALAVPLLGGLGWAALAPIETASHDELFEIPRGTSARRMAGEHLDILPQTIRLTLGVNDVLVLRNADTVPHIFGPTLIMPGQSFRLPFVQASTYSFLCSAHANGQLNIVVDPVPAPGWGRLHWRLRRLTNGA